jgi:hypothetical protein
MEESGNSAGIGYGKPPKETRFGGPRSPARGPGSPKGIPRIKNRLEKLLAKRAPQKVIEQLQSAFPELKNTTKIYESIDLGVLVAAMMREPWAVTYVSDHTEGLLSQKVNIGGQQDNQLPALELESKLSSLITLIAKNEADKASGK